MSSKKTCATWIAVVLLTLFVQGPGFGAEPFVVNLAVLSQLRLEGPESPEAKSYLGIRGKEAFTLPTIAAKTLIVQVFSMYCPYCQADAPEVNKLYRRIQENPRLKNNVKIIGIGTGNTPFEVNLFKEKFKVPFPVFPDEKYSVQKACSKQIRTPLFIVVKPDAAKKGLTEVFVQLGKIGAAETFLKKITHQDKR